LGARTIRAADRDALALPARQRLGLAIEQLADLEDAGSALDPVADLALVQVGELERERHVVVDRHVRVQRVALEHHRDAALGRRQVVGALAIDHDVTGGDGLQPGDQAQQGRLAAARRADEHDELAFGDGQADATDDVDRVERFADVAQDHGGHVRRSDHSRSLQFKPVAAIRW